MNKTAVEDGYNAFLNGESFSDNPYERLTREHRDWSEGYETALDESISREMRHYFRRASE